MQKKISALTIFFVSIITIINAQSTSQPASKKKIPLTPGKSVQNKFIVKFISDAEATLYIDGEKKGSLKKDIPLRVSLAKGEYIIKVVSNSNENDFLKWLYTVEETTGEKLEEVLLTKVINERLAKETVINAIPKIEMVTVGNFAIGKYETTQKQWASIMKNNPSGHIGCDDCPVENVTYAEVEEFIQKLNELTQKKYRLPTKEEWHFALRSATDNFFEDFSIKSMWCKENSDDQTHPVGQKQPIRLGIYDMLGNVSEWVGGWYKYKWGENDTRNERVFCGRSAWDYGPTSLDDIYYKICGPVGPEKATSIGFRLAISL